MRKCFDNNEELLGVASFLGDATSGAPPFPRGPLPRPRPRPRPDVDFGAGVLGSCCDGDASITPPKELAVRGCEAAGERVADGALARRVSLWSWKVLRIRAAMSTLILLSPMGAFSAPPKDSDPKPSENRGFQHDFSSAI